MEALDQWYAAGLRSLGPAWSRANAFAHGVPFVFPSCPDIGQGSTDAGSALIRRCSELGILIDLSHLVGIVFATAFLRPDFGDTAETPLALIVEHVRYVAERIARRTSL